MSATVEIEQEKSLRTNPSITYQVPNITSIEFLTWEVEIVNT